MKKLISYIIVLGVLSSAWWIRYLPKPKEAIKRDKIEVRELNYPRTLKEF